MSVASQVRWVLAVAVAGVVSNFFIDDLSDPVTGAAYSPWGPLAAGVAADKPDLKRIGPIFGINPSGAFAVLPPPEPVIETGRRFTFKGVNYRLSGLVMEDELGSATFISEAGETARVTVGDAMPSGERIVSISLDELLLLTEDDSRESVVIYDR